MNIQPYITAALSYIAHIADLFGKTTGFRIGGTTGAAIASFVIAKLVEDKAPSWVKWGLYLAGGAMAAGGGANILQLFMRYLPQ
jgi:biotin transporter BioY